LDDLLGLGTDVVEQTLVELSNCVPGLTREHDKFRASSEANRTLTNKEFAKTVLQPRKFIVNGLGDDLLPIDFWRHHEEWRLYPNPEHPAGAFCDAAGQASEITVKIRDRMGCGRENLLQLINAKDSIARDRAGIPRGAFGMIDEPESIEVAWVTSFLLVADDGAISIVSPSKQPLSLLDPKFARKDYLIRICEGLKPRDIDQHAFPAACDSISRTFGDCAEITSGDVAGQVLVRVTAGRSAIDRVPGDADRLSRPASRLISALIRGRFWDLNTKFILRMVPADAETAQRVALLRAPRDLRIVLRSQKQDTSRGESFDVALWWSQWQEQFGRELPAAATICSLSLDILLKAADDMQDTEFAERLEVLIRNRS
jgi:hypothetical protein